MGNKQRTTVGEARSRKDHLQKAFVLPASDFLLLDFPNQPGWKHYYRADQGQHPSNGDPDQAEGKQYQPYQGIQDQG
jgi:hypothetical protein